MPVKYCLLTIPRSGSQFLFRLLEAVVGADDVRPTSGLTPGRWEKADGLAEGRFRDLRDDNRPTDYFSEIGARSVKIELPASDDLAYRIAETFPSCVFIGSFRPFHKIASSHARLSWGKPPSKLLKSTESHVAFLEEFRQNHPVYIVDIENSERFNLDRFHNFLTGKTEPVADPNFVNRWAPVNDNVYRAERDGGKACDEKALSLDEKTARAGARSDRTFLNWVSSDNDLPDSDKPDEQGMPIP